MSEGNTPRLITLSSLLLLLTACANNNAGGVNYGYSTPRAYINQNGTSFSSPYVHVNTPLGGASYSCSVERIARGGC